MSGLGRPTVVATLIPGRCGSSYLAEIIRQTGVCGNGNEIFFERPVRAWQAAGVDFSEFFISAVRANLAGGVFWFQITPDQFEDIEKIIDPEIFKRWAFTAIFRRDILAQAISFTYAVKSGVWHVKKSEEEVQLNDSFGEIEQKVQFYLLSVQLSELKAHRILEVIAHPTPAMWSAGEWAASTKRRTSSTEARFALAVLTTERKAA